MTNDTYNLLPKFSYYIIQVCCEYLIPKRIEAREAVHVNIDTSCKRTPHFFPGQRLLNPSFADNDLNKM